MSKIGNYRVSVQESDEYRSGWQAAECGEPYPTSALAGDCEEMEKLERRQIGWNDYFLSERQP